MSGGGGGGGGGEGFAERFEQYQGHLERLVKSYVRLVRRLREEEDRWRWEEEIEEAEGIIVEAYRIAKGEEVKGG
jgi:hypothetical protein